MKDEEKIPLGFDGCYEIKISMLIKTMGKKFSRKELLEIIDGSLASISVFRDVDIYEFELN